MRGVDLAQFQFDYDLTWAALFLRADGAVYARFGNGGGDADAAHSLAALRRTLERVLELHAADPSPAALAGRRGPRPRYEHAEDIPVAAVQQVSSGAIARDNCIHCHMIFGGFNRLEARRPGYDGPSFARRRYPPPTVLGFELHQVEGNLVTAVAAGSPAERGGIRVGDRLRSLAGELVLSLADAHWALHQAPDGGGDLAFELDRDGETVMGTLSVVGDWKIHDAAWRVSMLDLPPELDLWVEEVDPSRRRALALADDKLGLVVRGAFGANVRRAGLERGDVIIAVDGRDGPLTEIGFHVHVRMEHFRPGSKLALDVLRDGARRSIEVEL